MNNVKNYVEVEPDDWDIDLLSEAEKENDGSVISLEQLSLDILNNKLMAG